MPRVEHRKAAKDYPASGIKKGEKYYTWKFKFGGRQRQKQRPLPEQLTQSPYLQEWLPLQREISTFDGTADDLENLIEQVRNLAQDQQDKLDNMPEGLQDGHAGETLRERGEECEEIVSTLEDLKSQLEEFENEQADGNGDATGEAAADDERSEHRDTSRDDILIARDDLVEQIRQAGG